MGSQARIDATFRAEQALSAALVSEGMPAGNGSGPAAAVHKRSDGSVHIRGLLQEFDELDWPNVLAGSPRTRRGRRTPS